MVTHACTICFSFSAHLALEALGLQESWTQSPKLRPSNGAHAHPSGPRRDHWAIAMQDQHATPAKRTAGSLKMFKWTNVKLKVVTCDMIHMAWHWIFNHSSRPCPEAWDGPCNTASCTTPRPILVEMAIWEVSTYSTQLYRSEGICLQWLHCVKYWWARWWYDKLDQQKKL